MKILKVLAASVALVLCLNYPLFAQVCSFTEADFADGGTFGETCTLDVGADLTITGTITWTTGTLTIDGNGAAGDLIVNGTGSIDIQGGAIEMDDGSITVNTGGNITINSGTQANPGLVGANAQLWAISGTMDVYGAVATVNTNGGDIDVDGGTFTIYNGGYAYCADDFQVFNDGTLDVQVGGELFFEDNLRNKQGNNTPPGSEATFIINGVVNGGDPDGFGSTIAVLSSTPQSSISGTGTVTVDDVTNTTGGGEFVGCGGTANCNENGLPVELVSFAGEIQGTTAAIEWVTASELNNEGFFIEKSDDGLTFEQIGFVHGFGTTNETQYYSFEDVRYLGDTYYRLKQVDYDGAFEYSPIIFLGSNGSFNLKFYPNPTTGEISFLVDPQNEFRADLIDVSGSKIAQIPLSGVRDLEEKLRDELRALNDGIYFIQLSNRNQIYTGRVFLKK